MRGNGREENDCDVRRFFLSLSLLPRGFYKDRTGGGEERRSSVILVFLVPSFIRGRL